MTQAGRIAAVARWSAKVWSVASVGFVLLFVIGELTAPSAVPLTDLRDIIALALFPFGVCLGLVMAWRWEGLGGAVAVGSLAAFYALMWVVGGKLPRGPYFALVAAPAVPFLLAWGLARRRQQS